MNINQLHDDWINAGHKVEDLLNQKIALQNKYNVDPESVTAEDMEKAAKDYKNAIKARDFAKQNYEDARANLKPEKKTNIKNNIEEQNKKSIANTFKDMLTHPTKYMDMNTSSRSDDGAAGITIPDDQQTQINTLMRQYDDLRDLVTTENVGTDTGTRNIEPFSNITPMDQMDDISDDSKNYAWQNKEIKEGDYPSLKQIRYQIHDYGDIFYAPNDLRNDSNANIDAWLNQHIARKEVVTYNTKIIGLLPDSQKKATIIKLDDIIDAMGQLNMALWGGATLLTNKSGFLTLAKVRMSDGSRAMSVDPFTKQKQFNMDGLQYFNVKVVEDQWLPNNVDSKGTYKSHPFYFGNFKEYIHLFDRQQPSLLTSNVTDAAFKKNQTAIRAMLRFDTKIWDDEAIVSGSFDKVASQPMLMQSVSVPNPGGTLTEEQK